jgi:uncharacterized protein YndB with AHSA1/START domain
MEPPQGAEQPPLIVSRLLNAPCQAVFAAWTTAEHVQRWMCPEGATVAVAALDVRVGGAFRIDMLVNGVQTAHTGVYREIRPPHRLVFTWVSAHTHFRPTLVTVDLRPHGDKTELTLTQTLLPDETSRERHAWGWTRLLDHLGTYLLSRDEEGWDTWTSDRG